MYTGFSEFLKKEFLMNFFNYLINFKKYFTFEDKQKATTNYADCVATISLFNESPLDTVKNKFLYVLPNEDKCLVDVFDITRVH
jgi:hypothetical protein